MNYVLHFTEHSNFAANRKITKLMPAISMLTCREQREISLEVILVRLCTQTDFGGIFKIIQIYERYDGANKMQIEQH